MWYFKFAGLMWSMKMFWSVKTGLVKKIKTTLCDVIKQNELEFGNNKLVLVII